MDFDDAWRLTRVRLMCALLASDKETTCGGYSTTATASLATAGVRLCACVWIAKGGWLDQTNLKGECVFVILTLAPTSPVSLGLPTRIHMLPLLFCFFSIKCVHVRLTWMQEEKRKIKLKKNIPLDHLGNFSVAVNYKYYMSIQSTTRDYFCNTVNKRLVLPKTVLHLFA